YPLPLFSTPFPSTTLFRSDPGQRFFELAAMDFLEQLGQLAREHDLARRLECADQGFHTVDDAMRCLIQNEGRVHALERGQFRFRSEEHTSELQSRSDLVCR